MDTEQRDSLGAKTWERVSRMSQIFFREIQNVNVAYCILRSILYASVNYKYISGQIALAIYA